MSSNRVLFAIFTVALASGCARAQTNRAIILQGTVTEPGNSAVPNVAIELRDVATGVVRTATASSEGIFRFNRAALGMHDRNGMGDSAIADLSWRSVEGQ